MRVSDPIGALRRKLRALDALARDAAVTDNEKANAQALGARLKRRLKDAGAPAGDWTDNLFRFGRRLREVRDAAEPAAPKGDWTDEAHRLGKALRRGLRRLSSK